MKKFEAITNFLKSKETLAWLKVAVATIGLLHAIDDLKKTKNLEKQND